MAVKTLSTGQLVAIGYLAQPKNGNKSYAEIAEECGVTEMTLYRWRNDDYFVNELRKEQRRYVVKYVPDVIKAMVDNAISEGNAAAAKLVLQMADQLTEKHEISTPTTDTPDIDELKRLVADIDA